MKRAYMWWLGLTVAGIGLGGMYWSANTFGISETVFFKFVCLMCTGFMLLAVAGDKDFWR